MKVRKRNENGLLPLYGSKNDDNGKKLATLLKYQEINDNDDEYTNDFDLVDGDNFSFSRFSQVSSGSSLTVKNDSKTSSNTVNSPFLKKIQNQNLQIEFDKPISSQSNQFLQPAIAHEVESLDFYGKSRGLISKKMESISEGLLITTGKENKSPFVDSSINPRKIRESQNILLKTPTKASKRQSSVKVSLTPAQKYEKKLTTRLNNALENFQFSTLIGKGAFANVYRGINLITNQVVAIKQIILQPDQNVMELMGEIDLLKILKHPNIVKYHGFVKTSTSLNVFLEYCSGGSLRQYYKKLNHGLPEHQIIQYVKLILLGLNYLHEQGVVHRDVKAANVLIDANDNIKLADFGVAARVTSEHETVVGTPNWMAPETVIGGEGLCTASDIWSLGATIIELFTTHPPYHDLNPMATLHAIGTDDHPPLPKHISPLAKDFLLGCFQKQPALRSSAKVLLKHKWLGDNATNMTRTSIANIQSNIKSKPITSYRELNDENWEKDFTDVTKIKQSDSDIIQLKDTSLSTFSDMKISKTQLLNKFSEDFNEDFDEMKSFENININKNIEVNECCEQEEEDPFLEIDVENFDTAELEIRNKMEYLVSKFRNKVDICRSGNDDVIASLIKITGRMLHLVQKYPLLHDTLIRDHGLISLMELLDEAPDLPKTNKLWFYTLSILNTIFKHNILEFETFCLLGGIPSITHFRNPSYDIEVRLQVVEFIKQFSNSERAISMLVSSGGLKVVTKFVEEDFDFVPSFPLTSVDCIHGILTRDLTRFKSDICRILSKYGVVFWFIVLLNRLTNTNFKLPKSLSREVVQQTVTKILDILKYFTQSEVRVRINISNPELFKLLIRTYYNLNYDQQLIILKYFKALSNILEILPMLYGADFLEFLVRLLESYPQSNANFKEVMNIVCPMLYNCCYLNHRREYELIRLGGLPYLKALATTNLPFRQFILPILCELVYCDDSIREGLKSNDILTVYYNLLLDPYWQSNALDSILTWYQQDQSSINFQSHRAVDCIVGGFLLNKVSNMESTLDNYLKLCMTNLQVARMMFLENIIQSILQKLHTYAKNSVVQLTLLRLLKLLLNEAKVSNKATFNSLTSLVSNQISTLKLSNGSILIKELVQEIEKVLKD